MGFFFVGRTISKLRVNRSECMGVSPGTEAQTKPNGHLRAQVKETCTRKIDFPSFRVYGGSEAQTKPNGHLRAQVKETYTRTLDFPQIEPSFVGKARARFAPTFLALSDLVSKVDLFEYFWSLWGQARRARSIMQL
jgi:hypothetical protein